MIDRLERLINLVIALRETRRPLSAEEIRHRVAGYGQDDHEAFRRMFERDKADLRALGVPVETKETATGDDVEGYRIAPDTYDLPAVDFPPDELATLGLALQATGLLDEAATGLRKVEVGVEVGRGTAPEGLPAPEGLSAPEAFLAPDGPRGLYPRHGPVVRVPLADRNRPVLTEAQLTRTRVRFTYRRADGVVSARLVEPYGMVFRGGHWYVVGRDCGRGAVRSFRLDRITDRVRTAGRAGAFPAPAEPVDVDAVLPDAAGRRVTARLAVAPTLEWRVARRARGGGAALPDGRTAYDVVATSDEIVSLALEEGPEVEVLAPPALRTQIRAHLEAVVAAHDGPGGAR